MNNPAFGEKRCAFAGKGWNSGGVLGFFPPELRQILMRVPEEIACRVAEIRLRSHQPLELNCGSEYVWLTAQGDVTTEIKKAFRLSSEGMKTVMNALTAGSYYALEEAIAQGYLGLPGGHRVGFTGMTLYEGERIRLIRNISSINFRIARAVLGIAQPLMPFLWSEARPAKTLILAPPAAGKTTLLREIIREYSNGMEQYGIAGIRIGVVDERSEIAGSFLGEPQLDVGRRTDVLDACSKREGVYLLLRTMNPELIATDEIGRPEDCAMLTDIVNTGVGFIATAHARDLDEALERPGLKRILETGMVERVIVLSHRLGVGTIESVRSGVNGKELLPAAFRPVERYG